MQQTKLEIVVDTTKTYLFSDCRLFKTEGFIRETRLFDGVDSFLEKIAESVRLNAEKIENLLGRSDSFMLSVNEQSLFFKFGKTVESANGGDVIFYKYVGMAARIGDKRLLNFLKNHSNFTVTVRRVQDNIESGAFNKLYQLSGEDGVNFPRLNEEQLAIVTTEDKNILVQGVAGSGKTNICIDRIIWAACREYGGKVLYSTYSRGLLSDTERRVNGFIKRLSSFVDDFKNGRTVFIGEQKKSLENKLGIWFNTLDDDKIIDKIERIILYLKTKVDYFLLEDLYREATGVKCDCADEEYFSKHYVSNLKNYNLAGNFEKIKNLSVEVIYKEIYGMIFGSCVETEREMLSEQEYTQRRKDSFSKFECETLYAIAQDYYRHLKKVEKQDNNLLSRELLQTKLEPYSLAVLDEVQDFTQINLVALKALSRRMFCVGDALQMINPTYFGFAFLKRLMFDKDTSTVKELKHNYRNSQKIEEIIEALGDINVARFGTHSFVLRGASVDTHLVTSAVYVRTKDFSEKLSALPSDNYTLVVSTLEKKAQLRRLLPKTEILTVSEIKGLERENIVLTDVLSDNKDKWNRLERLTLNRKTADENSVYRYYFNLFYVGVSRAKQNLYVIERETVDLFEDFFKSNFETKSADNAALSLALAVGKAGVDLNELYKRIEEFIKAGQYDNARFTAQKLDDEEETKLQNARISVYETHVKNGDYKAAGIDFWELGLIEEAKRQFEASKSPELSALVDACAAGEGGTLNWSVSRFYPEVSANETARRIICDTLKKDLAELKTKQKALGQAIKASKRKR